MSLHTTTTISIDGHEFRQFHRLTLEQTIDGHHTFELLIGYDWLVSLGKGLFTASRKFLGKEISILVSPVEKGDEPLTFNGLVTAVNTGKENDGTHGFCVISGCSPTIVLDGEPHIQAFERQSLSEMVQTCFRNGNPYIGRPTVSPAFTGVLPYTVQYKESHYAFLQRMAGRYGEWFFYDGQKIVFGTYTPRKIKLTHQTNLVSFDLQLKVLPNNRQFHGYEYSQDSSLQSAVKAVGRMNGYTEEVAGISKKLYSKPSLYKNDQGYDDAKVQLEQLSDVHQQSRQAQQVQLRAASKHPGIRVGDTVSILESQYGIEDHGSFTVTSIRHQCTGNGQYSNQLTGIPEDIARPQRQPGIPPVCEAQSAVVVDNNDPAGLGRIRVRFRWQQQGATPWIRQIAPHGGGQKGVYFIPETGEEVWVDFEGGNPELPFALGAVYNGNAKSDFADAENNIKAIKTRSGHVIRLDDTNGKESITITDKNNNIIVLDTSTSSITITAPETMTLNAKNMKINVENNLETRVGNNSTLHVENNISTIAKNKIDYQAGHDFALGTARNFYVNSNAVVDIFGKKQIIQYGEKIDMGAAQNMHLHGQQTLVSAKDKIEYKAPEMNKVPNKGGFTYTKEPAIVDVFWMDGDMAREIGSIKPGEKASIYVQTRNVDAGETVKITLLESFTDGSENEKQLEGTVDEQGLAQMKEVYEMKH
ncbi:hypothetical protein HF329_09625 [Chitinophaga oryzae]|uniref:Gp5/Type VI secretion system Vgr protein OB-fold domain-containing protein n=1 Tax=Chitinophaga oryzae TaxID=2725414 RepID=A0AAE6ZEL9_9BACT|nr:phage baseplate assembly protein V [Chitinophaga oryzae]QJB31553.1 hypothetical protein HF329_09625 [Chitinophaga oryzae]